MANYMKLSDIERKDEKRINDKNTTDTITENDHQRTNIIPQIMK